MITIARPLPPPVQHAVDYLREWFPDVHPDVWNVGGAWSMQLCACDETRSIAALQRVVNHEGMPWPDLQADGAAWASTRDGLCIWCEHRTGGTL